MADNDSEVVIVGGGAAGIAAARSLHDTGIACLIVEARGRLGGRAWTVNASGYPLDAGCGWLHAADGNAWTGIAERQGLTIDRTPPPWDRPSRDARFTLADQREFMEAQLAADRRLDAMTPDEPDRPASAFLEPGCRWNPLLNAVSSYYSGAELERISALDLARYREDNLNWRIVEGYGAAIAAHGLGLPSVLDCPVRRIDHRGRRLRIETAKGDISAERAIVTLPTPIIADPDFFSPALPEKAAAGAGLPLGLADKLFLSLENAGEFESNSRLFGRIDRTATGSYHLRPFGRPLIECYFGGAHAWQLEAGGEAAFFDFAREELSDAFGTSFARRIKPLQLHRWGADPFARGSYSYAAPGKSDCRASLAAPVDDRLFFAGEACHRDRFSTAHGAFESGRAAAGQVIAARGAR